MANAPQNFEDLKKRIQSDEIVNLLSEVCVLQGLAKFESGKKLGELYTFPAIVRRAGGHTVGVSGTKLNLNDSSGFQTVKGELKAFQHVIEQELTLSDLVSTEDDDQAYQVWKDGVLGPALMAFKNRVEHHLLLGSFCGTIASSADVGAGLPNEGKKIATISGATWADAIWAGAEGADRVDIYNDASSTTVPTHASVLVLDMDFDNKTLTLDTTVAIAANASIHWEKSRGLVKPSLREQLINATGSIFGIDSALYPMTRTVKHTIATTGVLNFVEVSKAAAKSLSKGQVAEDVYLFANPQTIQNMANELVGKQAYDSSYKPKKGEMGFEEISYKVTSGFEIKIISHPLVFLGEAYIVPRSQLKRFGACEVKMGMPVPGQDEGSMFYNVPGTTAVAFKIFTEQCIANMALGRSVIIRNASGTAI